MNRGLKTAALLAAAATIVLAGATSADATAAKPLPPTAGKHPTFPALAVNGVTAGAAMAKSTIGAGYFTYPGTPNVSSATVQFTVPEFSCNTTREEGIFPGIWVYDGTGTLTQQVDYNLYCIGGVVNIVGVVCIYGSSEGCVTGLNASPGDRIVASFSESAWATQGQLKNLTAGTTSYIYDGTPAPTADATVFFGIAGPDAFAAGPHVPTFNTVVFSKAQIDGYYLSEYTSRQAVALKSASSVQVKTGALRQDGDVFTTTWIHF